MKREKSLVNENTPSMDSYIKDDKTTWCMMETQEVQNRPYKDLAGFFHSHTQVNELDSRLPVIVSEFIVDCAVGIKVS